MDFDEYQAACERTANRGPHDNTERRLANFALVLAARAASEVGQ